MRMKRMIDGLDNGQKIRVIVDGVGFHTTVKGAFDLVYYHHRVAAVQALTNLALKRILARTEKPTGFATTYDVRKLPDVTGDEGKLIRVDVQVDLL